MYILFLFANVLHFSPIGHLIHEQKQSQNDADTDRDNHVGENGQ